MSGMYRDRVKGKGAKKRISFQRIVQLISVVLVNSYIVGFQKGKIFTAARKPSVSPSLTATPAPVRWGPVPSALSKRQLGA